jgi:hypothetical protein
VPRTEGDYWEIVRIAGPTNSHAHSTATSPEHIYESVNCCSHLHCPLRSEHRGGARRPLQCRNRTISNSRCGNPQETRTQGQWHANRSRHRSIDNQRQARSNGPSSAHRQSLRRRWRAPSDLMHEGIERDAHGHSPPPRQCTICNDRKRVTDRRSWLVQNKILRRSADHQNRSLLG